MLTWSMLLSQQGEKILTAIKKQEMSLMRCCSDILCLFKDIFIKKLYHHECFLSLHGLDSFVLLSKWCEHFCHAKPMLSVIFPLVLSLWGSTVHCLLTTNCKHEKRYSCKNYFWRTVKSKQSSMWAQLPAASLQEKDCRIFSTEVFQYITLLEVWEHRRKKIMCKIRSLKQFFSPENVI